MTNANHHTLFTAARLPLLALALLAVVLASLSGGGTARVFTLGENLDGLEFDLAESATLTEDNGDPIGIWSDGETVWVADHGDDKLYAYTMDPEGDNHGDRDSSKDITLAADNGDPTGIWSDGTTIWVADHGDDKLFAYTLSTRNRASARDLALHGDNGEPAGIFSDGTSLWASDIIVDKLFAYSQPPRVTPPPLRTGTKINLWPGRGCQLLRL